MALMGKQDACPYNSDMDAGKEKHPALAGCFPIINFPAATYSPTPQGRSTIGAEGLSCRVRNGNGRFPLAKATGKKLQPSLSRYRQDHRQKPKVK